MDTFPSSLTWLATLIPCDFTSKEFSIAASDHMGFQGVYLLPDLDTEESTEEYDGNQCDFVTHVANNRIQFIFLSVSSPIT